MTIESPLLSLALYWTATFRAPGKPSSIGMLDQPRLTVAFRFGWLASALMFAYALGRTQGWLL